MVGYMALKSPVSTFQCIPTLGCIQIMTNGSPTIVLHNLGGCSIEKDRDHGVVDSFGRVY